MAPHPEGWDYTDKARLRGLRKLEFLTSLRSHPSGWSYTDKARLRGLRKLEFLTSLRSQAGFLAHHHGRSHTQSDGKKLILLFSLRRQALSV